MAPRVTLALILVVATFATAPFASFVQPASAAIDPRAPSNLTAVPGPNAGQISLNWTAPTTTEEIQHYRIYAKNGSAARRPLANVSAGEVTYVHTVIDKTIPYVYDVVAVYKQTPTNLILHSLAPNQFSPTREGPVSNKTVGTWAPAPRPLDPAAAPGPGAGEITFTWSAPASGGTVLEYRIYTKPRGGFHLLAGTTDSATLSLTLGGLNPLTPVSFNVSAFFDSPKGGIEGNLTAGVTSFPLGEIPLDPIAEPGTAEGDIDLTWTAPTGATPVAEYRVYRRTFASPTEVLTATVIGATTLTQSGLDVNTRYFYRVAAAYDDGLGGLVESARSLETSAVPLGKPLAPQGIGARVVTVEADDSGIDYDNLTGTLTIRSGQVVVSWTEPARDGGSAILSYTVERRIDGGAWHAAGSTDGENLTLETSCPSLAVCNYRVFATNVVGNSPYSAVATVRGLVEASEDVVLP